MLAIRRFEELIGTKPVTAITPRAIRSFRDQCFKLPARVKKRIKALPANEQVGLAAEQKLPTLSPPSVGKQVPATKSWSRTTSPASATGESTKEAVFSLKQ